jgi:hypothetical protein
VSEEARAGVARIDEVASSSQGGQLAARSSAEEARGEEADERGMNSPLFRHRINMTTLYLRGTGNSFPLFHFLSFLVLFSFCFSAENLLIP